MVEEIWKGDIRVFLLVFVKESYILNLQVTLLGSDPPISMLLSKQNYNKLNSSWNCCRAQQQFNPLLFNFPLYQTHSRKEINHSSLDANST